MVTFEEKRKEGGAFCFVELSACGASDRGAEELTASRGAPRLSPGAREAPGEARDGLVLRDAVRWIRGGQTVALHLQGVGQRSPERGLLEAHRRGLGIAWLWAQMRLVGERDGRTAQRAISQ